MDKTLMIDEIKELFHTGPQGSADALLVIEIAETSLSYDRDVKVPRYAAAGIPEVWIEDLTHDQLLVYRDPGKNGYLNALTLRRADSISPLAFPDVTFKVGDLLPSENQ